MPSGIMPLGTVAPHHMPGAPARVIGGQTVGPYVLSVWAMQDVGMSNVYVVYRPRAGVPFVTPTAVRVGIAPTSGRLAESYVQASAQPIKDGARFVAHVMFDRAEPWRMRVVTDGPAGGGEVAAVVSVALNALGPSVLALYGAPFVLVAMLWGRVAIARRTDPSPARSNRGSQRLSR